MFFEQTIPTATSLWNLVQYVHETVSKAFEATLYLERFRCTSYRDRGEDVVKVQSVESGLYTMYQLDEGVWRRMEGY